MTQNGDWLPSPAESQHGTAVVPYGSDTPAWRLDQLQKTAYGVYLSRLAKGSVVSARSTLNKVSQMLYHLPAEQAPWHTMSAYQFNFVKRALVEMGYAPKTVHRHLCMVRSVLKTAKELQQIPQDNMADFGSIMETKNVSGTSGRGEIKPHRALQDDEVQILFASLAKDTSPAGLRDMAMLALMRGTGLRRMEVANLSMEDIRWSSKPHGALRLKKTKGSKPRVVPMPPGLREILARWVDFRGEDPGPVFMAIKRNGKPVYETEKGLKAGAAGSGVAVATVPKMSGGLPIYRQLNRASINYVMEKRYIEAGLDKATPHDLRYTFAVKNLRNSDLQVVADLMGHSNVSTTSIYTQTSDEKMIETVSKDNLFNVSEGNSDED